MAIRVSNEVNVIEVNGREKEVGETTAPLTVTSHWNVDRYVVLTLGKEKITVNGNDLMLAIANAQNRGR